MNWNIASYRQQIEHCKLVRIDIDNSFLDRVAEIYLVENNIDIADMVGNHQHRTFHITEIFSSFDSWPPQNKNCRAQKKIVHDKARPRCRPALRCEP